MINLYAFEWDTQLLAERRATRTLSALRFRAWRRLLRRDVSAEELREKLRYISPRRLRSRVGQPAERRQRDAVVRALDTLRAQDTRALMMFSDGQPLPEQLSRQGYLGELGRWPNLTLEWLRSPENLFRSFPLQRQVHGSLDRALDVLLARALAPAHGGGGLLHRA